MTVYGGPSLRNWSSQLRETRRQGALCSFTQVLNSRIATFTIDKTSMLSPIDGNFMVCLFCAGSSTFVSRRVNVM